MIPSISSALQRRTVADNVWLSYNTDEIANRDAVSRLEARALQPEILPSEEAVGAAMLAELDALRTPKLPSVVWTRANPCAVARKKHCNPHAPSLPPIAPQRKDSGLN